MNILLTCNRFEPHDRGVSRVIERFTARYRYRGHHVRIVAPMLGTAIASEIDVIRVPSLHRRAHLEVGPILPIPRGLGEAVERFEPDVIHAFQPFGLGGSALRIAHTHQLPIVFGCEPHAPFEVAPGIVERTTAGEQYVERLTTHYANLCDHVFVPDASSARLLGARGVTKPVAVVAYGVEADDFEHGDGAGFRKRHGIPQAAFVVGHVGRLRAGRQLTFLARAFVRFLQRSGDRHDAHCLVVGAGERALRIRTLFEDAGLSHRLHLVGDVDDRELPAALHAMDLFASAARTGTRGLALGEAMAAGRPVVAIDAPGVRERVEDGRNGRLLPPCDASGIANAIDALADAGVAERDRLSRGARWTASRLSMKASADLALELYSTHRDYDAAHRHTDFPLWVDALHTLGSEWELLENTVATGLDTMRHLRD